MKLKVLLIAFTILTLILSTVPVKAQFTGISTTGADVDVCTEFIIYVRILSDELDTLGLHRYEVIVTWDPSLMRLVNIEFGDYVPVGWESLLRTETGACGFWAYGGAVFPEDGEFIMAALTFHCEGEGSTRLSLPSEMTVDGFLFQRVLISFNTGDIPHETGGGLVNQYEPSTVGGITSPINKLEIIAPYIALAGLIIAVSAVYVIKKRKD